MVLLVFIVGFLKCPAVEDAVEDPGSKCGIASNLQSKKQPKSRQPKREAGPGGNHTLTVAETMVQGLYVRPGVRVTGDTSVFK